MQFTISFKNSFYCCFDPLKNFKFQISMTCHWKKRKINFPSVIFPPLHELHCSPIVHMNHMEPIFQDLPLYAPRRSQKPQSTFSLLSWGWNTLPGACSELDLHICCAFVTLTDRVCNLIRHSGRIPATKLEPNLP